MFWEEAMANARAKTRRVHNRKFPGVERLTVLLETMNSDELARELKVTRHTITNWIRRHNLREKAVKISYTREQAIEARAERRRIAELEHVGKIEGGIAALYARKRMSAAEGINGWRWSRPWIAETISAS
jgi:IS30 family transposase